MSSTSDEKSSYKAVHPSDEQKTFTLDEAVNTIGFGPFQWRLLFLCGFVWAADACEVMLLSFVIPAVRDDWNLSTGQDAVIGAVVFAGMFAGAYFWGILSDIYGRRKGVLGVVLFSFVFGFASAFSVNLAMLATLRFLVGFGVGGATVAFSLFAEYTPTSHRGLLLMVIELFWTTGVCIETGIAWVVMTHQDWKWLLAYSALPLCIMALLFPFVPESARFYQVTGKPELAVEVLEVASAMNGIPLPKGQLKVTPVTEGGSVQQLFSPSMRWLTLKLWFIWFADSLVYYGVAFITPRVFSHTSVYALTFITALFEIPGNLIPGFFLVDRFGRKKTLQAGFLLCAICLIVSIADLPLSVGVLVLSVARMSITACFSVTYIYTPEVYPTAIRTTGLGACAGVTRIAGIITSFLAEDISVSLAMVTFSAVAVVASVITASLPVETAGVDLDDVAEAGRNAQKSRAQGVPTPQVQDDQNLLTAAPQSDSASLEAIDLDHQ